MANRQSGINIKAILLGLLVNIGGNLLVSIIIGALLVMLLITQGVSATNLESRLEQLTQNFSFLIVDIVIGLGFTFLGGLTAATFAKTLEVTHAGIVGAIAILFGLLFTGALPLWYNVVAFLLTVPVSILAGYAAKR